MHPLNIVLTAHASGGRVMIWFCFVWSGPALQHYVAKIKSADYLNVMNSQLIPSIHLLFFPWHGKLQDGNAKIHWAQFSKEWFWSMNLNLTESLWNVLKKLSGVVWLSIYQYKLFKNVCLTEINVMILHKEVESRQWWTGAVIKAKGKPAKYSIWVCNFAVQFCRVCNVPAVWLRDLNTC